MKNAQAKNKKKFNGKIAGLTTLEVLFYILSLPLILVLSLVFGIKAYELVPYYSFWPFVGVILAGLLCLIFVIVVMCISLRKKSKRTILMQTVSIVIAAVMLTSFIAVMLDIVLPDVLAQLTSSTLFYEDLTQQSEEQAEFNAQLDRKFIMLNLLNGNYSPKYDYEAMKTNPEIVARSERIGGLTGELRRMTKEQYEKNYLSDEKYAELFEFIYSEYIMTDADYALLNPNVEFGNANRIGMGHAMAEYIYNSDDYATLMKEGMSNERIAELYANNYASLKNDGYLTYDDSMILYATSGRMTVPVVIRLLLDQGYTYTDGKEAYVENGEVVEPDGAYFLELYKPEEVKQIIDDGLVEWDSKQGAEGSRGVLKADAQGFVKGSVIIPYYEDGVLTGGYIRAPRLWSVLDMDGKNMDVAAISDVVVDLSSVLGSLLASAGEDIADLLSVLLKPMTIGELLNTLSPLLSNTILLGNGNSLFDIVDKLLQGVTDVIMEATGGAGLFLNLAVNDDGDLEIFISPTNVEVGMHGYQYMTWMESNNLLFAVMGVMSLRNWLYIFGAVSVLMAFAAGMCREIKSRVMKDVKDNEELALETAGAEDESYGFGDAQEDAADPADAVSDDSADAISDDGAPAATDAE